MNKSISEEYLISIGFSHIYDFKIKMNIPNLLFWVRLFAAGDYIEVKLNFMNDNWIISNLNFEGVQAFTIINEELKIKDIENIIKIVEKYGSSTI